MSSYTPRPTWLRLFMLVLFAGELALAKFSTQVPCAGLGTNYKSCVVTNTKQLITIARPTVFSTVYMPLPKKHSEHHKRKILRIDVIVTRYTVQYRNLGPLAIHGFPGSGLCTTCAPGQDGARNQVVQVQKCINNICKRAYRQTWRSKPTTTYRYHQQALTKTIQIESAGLQTIELIAETAVQATITDAPRLISYAGRVEEFRGKGQFVVTLDPGEIRKGIIIRQAFYYTIRISSGPQTIYFPGYHQYFPLNGQFGITIQPPVYATTFFQSGGIFNFGTIITQINNYYATTIYQTIVSGSTLPPVTVTTTTTDPGQITTATPTAAATNLSPMIIAGKQWKYEICGHPLASADWSLAFSSNKMTVELCQATCSSAVRAGLHDQDCYCSSVQIPVASDLTGSCSIRCPGDLSELCGGNLGQSKRDIAFAPNILFSIYKHLSVMEVSSSSATTPTSTTIPPPNPSVDMDIEPRQLDIPLAVTSENADAQSTPVHGPLHGHGERGSQKSRKRDFGIIGPAYL